MPLTHAKHCNRALIAGLNREVDKDTENKLNSTDNNM
jgi:hypothetical protein